MPTFSLKSLFALASLAAIASHVMARPTITAVVVVALLTVLSLSVLTAIGLWKRRPLLIAVAFVCCCYLGIADGGVYPGAEKYLPSEWLLCRCSTSHTVVSSGRKRSKSLAKWAARVSLEDNHKDLSLVSSHEWLPRKVFGRAGHTTTPVETTRSLFNCLRLHSLL